MMTISDMLVAVFCFLFANNGTAALYAAFFIWRLGEHDIAKRFLFGGVALVIATCALEFWDHSVRIAGAEKSISASIYHVCIILWNVLDILLVFVPCMLLKVKNIRPDNSLIALCFGGYFCPPLLALAAVRAVKKLPIESDDEGFAKSVDVTMQGEEI